MATFTYLNTLSCTSAATTAGSPNLTLLATSAGTLGVVIGTKVEHANIPADTYIIGFNSTTQAVMSNNATTTGSSLTVIATNPAIINMDAIPAQAGFKIGNDVYNISGPKLFVDSHSRYGVNQTTSTAIGTVMLSSTLGGQIEFNSTKVRLIAYDTGSGNVPALDTVISQGGASGKLLGVYSALNVAPTTAGSAMPATGFILIRQWNSVYYSAGALTGIGASATERDRAGWLEIVGVDALLQTVYRLNKWMAFGDYFDFLGVTTDGNRTTQYQLPTNGGNMYVPGVEVSLTAPQAATYTWATDVVTVTLTDHGLVAGDRVEINFTSGDGTPYGEYTVVSAPTTGTFTFALTGSGTGGNCTVTEYEFYPNAGSQTALDTKIATDAIRGRWCWISTTGLVSFGYDGTNSSGGYCPPSGRRIRVPNLFFQCCPAAGLTANTIPHATIASRMEFAVTGGGYVEMDKVSINWYMNLNQPFDIRLTNTFTFDNLALTECASPIAWYNVGVGQSAALSNYGFLLGTCFAGGTMDKCVWTRAVLSATGNYVKTISYIDGFTFINERVHQIYGNRGHATSGAMTLTYSSNCIWENCLNGGGLNTVSYCSDLEFINTTYYDHPATTTYQVANGNYMFVFSYTNYVKIDGINFGGLRMVQPVSGIFSAGTFSSYITLRNLGTYDAPLDLGDVRVDDVSWTRVTTTATITSVAHGLKVGDRFVVPICTNTAAITVAVKTVLSVPTPDTFTFTCVSSGTTSGTLSYFPTVSVYLFIVASAANNILVQRCFVPHTATNLFTVDNSVKNLRLDNIIGDYLNAFRLACLNLTIRSVSGSPPLTAETSTYGTHRLDAFNADVTTNLTNLSWSRTTTVCTVTCADHKLRTGLLINVTTSDDKTAVPLGTKSVTVINSSTFTFTCLNAGATSGVLDIRTVVNRIILMMNEATAETADQISNMTGTAAFTSAGGLVLPTIGDSVTFESPTWRYGFTDFSAAPVVMGTAAIANFRIEYQLDKNNGSGYGAWHNMYYREVTGSGGGAGTYTFTVTDASRIEVGDYVIGTGVGGLAKVTDITDTTITVDEPNTGAVSGLITFYAHQRNEVLSGLGFKFKIRITSIATYATAITSLSIYADSDDTSRAKLYPLDEYNLTFTGLQTGTRIAVRESGTENLLDIVTAVNGSAIYTYNEAGVTVDFAILAPGYLFQKITGYTLDDTDVSIPISQNVDYGYVASSAETITFNGTTKRIICDAGTTSISVPGIYSMWVDWALTDDNLQYLAAFSELGGNTIDSGAGTKVPVYGFLINGWRISPDEANHTLAVTGGIILVDGGGDPFVDTVGDYTVRINYQQPVQAIVVSVSTGSGLSEAQNTQLMKTLTVGKFLGLK